MLRRKAVRWRMPAVGQSRHLALSDYFRSSPGNGHCQDRSPSLKSAKPGSGLCLLDHLVRTGEKGCRNLDTEQFRCLEIDGKQEFGGLLRSLEVCGLTGQINPTRIVR